MLLRISVEMRCISANVPIPEKCLEFHPLNVLPHFEQITFRGIIWQHPIQHG